MSSAIVAIADEVDVVFDSKSVVVVAKPSFALKTAQLPLLPGIDVAVALDRLNGNQKLFRSLLLEMKRDFGHMVNIHSIKGVAGNLGASGLFEAARNLEQGVKTGETDQWPLLVAEFEKNLVQVMETISLLEPGEPICDAASADPVLDREEFGSLVEELTPLLTRRDIKTEECLSRRRGQLDASGGHPALTRLSEQIDQFDFEGAMVTLTSMTHALNIPACSKEGKA